METNSFTRLKVAYTNIESKTRKMVSYLNLLPLYEEFSRGADSHAVMLPTIFTNADTRIKEVEIGHHKIKQ